MGLITGEWRFADIDRVPSIQTLASELASATSLQVVQPIDKSATNRLEIPILGESLFHIEYTGSSVSFCSFVPAHPYLWENLDRVLEKLGGSRIPDGSHWRPDVKFRHLRQPWANLTAKQRLLLRLPTIGASRFFDRFV